MNLRGFLQDNRSVFEREGNRQRGRLRYRDGDADQVCYLLLCTGTGNRGSVVENLLYSGVTAD